MPVSGQKFIISKFVDDVFFTLFFFLYRKQYSLKYLEKQGYQIYRLPIKNFLPLDKLITDCFFFQKKFARNRSIDPIFAVTVGLAAAAQRIRREEKFEHGHDAKQTLEVLRRRFQLLMG